ncbi:MAG: zinc-ribbon domain-containing protein [Deltaproteobacteria bacterium]|nr:zinc-ribbon domain-containing protein [Deltaproteobacteria bacterium]
MIVTCSNCQKVYDIPDERLPKKDSLAFPCPACKETIKLDLRSSSSPMATVAHPVRQDKEQEQPTGETLKRLILKTIHDLPPMHQTVIKARDIMKNPGSSFEQLAAILSTDQAIAARVLKLANSAYYGFVGQVSSIQHASVMLGYKTLEQLITLAGTSNLLGKQLEGYEQDAGDLWQHSLGVAFGSKIIANRKNPALADDAFAAGLIHDAGKLALDPHLSERKETFRHFMADGRVSFLLAEKEILGFDHAEIASELCKNWHVPESLATAIRYHHDPSLSNNDELSYIVHTADAIAMMSGIGAGIDGMLYQMDDNAFEFLDLVEEDVSEIIVEIVESVHKISDIMQGA